ncbi:Fusaric acid resistance protein family [Raoultella terrigena]|uniref:Fusaric acid resistance protein family n=1 Tax=Raoultella terrigena TaxID=577 RepID=A0A4U9CXD9_RAOTE|nr:Fusaric acid resistance protein family [Raoultella terrigena]
MMMILPSTSDGTTLLTALKNMHARLLEHASLLWVPETTDAIRTAHESVIGQILTMNLLRIQAFWSHYRFRRQNPLLNYLLHQQLRMTSVISSLRRLLVNWPDAPKKYSRSTGDPAERAGQPARRSLLRRPHYCPAGARSRRRLSASGVLDTSALLLPPLSAEQPLDSAGGKRNGGDRIQRPFGAGAGPPH